MTIETTVNKTIQSGNGSNKDFDFAFEIPDEDSLSLTKRGSDGTETTITTNFTVTGIGDEAGGTVNYPTSGSALGASEKIIIKRVVALKQPENLRNQGDYSLEDIEDALDRAVMLCQQLQEQIDRSLKLNLTSSSTYVSVDDFIANRLLVISADGQTIEMSSAEYGSIDTYLSTLTAIAADISAVAAIDTEITTVAGIEAEILAVEANEANINIVAGIDTEITTVAGIAANITSVAGNATNINTVAGIAAAVTSVAAIAANVSTVAGISANVTTVAGMESDIASVVANMASILNAASFGFPTLSAADALKYLRVNSSYNGYEVGAKTGIASGDIPLIGTQSATDALAGTIEIATNAELAAATDTTRAVTAAAIASLFGTSLRSANGYARLPVKVGGAFVEIIFQWGVTASIAAGGHEAVVFPLAFSTAIINAQATISSVPSPNNGALTPRTSGQTTSGMNVVNQDGDSSYAAYWFVIGY